jgi:glycosyltransferase involved in cell wall biosynthesis
VHQQVPEARFVVVGKNPPPEVEALAVDPRVEVTGYVADPAPYLAAADAFVVPLHAGGGMRVKILDAWLWGLPTVSTPVGAEGIAARDGENILVAGDAPAFARATVRLLTDPELNRRLRDNGRTWVEAHYGWREVYRRVDQVYAGLLNARGKGDVR